MKNNMFNMYNSNVPILRNEYSSTIDKPWLSGDFIIPQTFSEINNYYLQSNVTHSLPLKPSIKLQMDTYYDHTPITNHDLFNSNNQNQPISPRQKTFYNTPKYSIYEETKCNASKTNCQTFDYNHSDKPFEYDDNIDSPRVLEILHPIEVTKLNQMPPECSNSMNSIYIERRGSSNEKSISDLHQESMSNNLLSNYKNRVHSVHPKEKTYHKKLVSTDSSSRNLNESTSRYINRESSKETKSRKNVIVPKRSDVLNISSQEEIVIFQEPRLVPRNAQQLNCIRKGFSNNRFTKKKKKKKKTKLVCKASLHLDIELNTSNITDKPKKGIPAWIIDDIKKLRRKEETQTNKSIDFYNARDKDGDWPMDYVYKGGNVNRGLSEKVVTNYRYNGLTKETDIDVDNGKYMTNIDNSNKTLIELIDMLDEREIEEIKITFIRDSLNLVMKEITDEMISSTVMLAFSHVLTHDNKCRKDKPKCNHTSKTVETVVTSQSLGLDVYESDNDDKDSSEQDGPSNAESDGESDNSSEEVIFESESDDNQA